MEEIFILETTFPNRELAQKLAKNIIELRLAKCVQLALNPVQSFYEWNGEIVEDQEYVLRAKLIQSKIEALKEFVTQNHSYQTPQIYFVKASDLSQSYADWMNQ